MIRAEITGADKILARLEALPGKLNAELNKSVTKMCLALTRKIKQDKLTGQVLNVKTGTLRRSISYKVEDTAAGPSGWVGTNLKYAAVHEFGFVGTVNVRAHMRQIKQAWGKTINPQSINISAHARQVNLPERSFLRSALSEMESDINTEMVNAVTRALK